VLLVDHNQTGYGGVGPAMNFAEIPAAGTWVLTLFMMPGRLDLFTVLIGFARRCGRNNPRAAKDRVAAAKPDE
jgi:Trk-type K+ transport system membrane component